MTEILRKPEYCGDTVNFRTYRPSFKSKKIILTSPDKWKIFRNTHPAIISREDFERVQERISVPHRHKPIDQQAFFYGLVYCADCGGKMYVRRTRNPNGNLYYICSTFRKAPVEYRKNPDFCRNHSISEVQLKELVLKEIQKLLLLFHTDSQKFEMLIQSRIESREAQSLSDFHEKMDECKKRLAQIDQYVQGLFEAKVRGEIDSELFGSLSVKYNSEKEELKAELEKLMQMQGRIEDLSRKAVILGTRVHKYDTISELTSEILSDFVERIEVEEKTTSGRKPDKNRKIKVFFYGVGLLDLD